jgi:hypothetical protein
MAALRDRRLASCPGENEQIELTPFRTCLQALPWAGLAALGDWRAAFVAQLIVVAATALFIRSLSGILQLKR